MSFIASKLLWIDPMTVLFLMLAGGGLLLWAGRWPRVGRFLIGTGTLAVVLVATVPLGEWSLLRLEDRFPIVRTLPPRVDGIIVLGGFVDQFISAARGQPSVNGAVGRLIEFVALAREHPEARLIITGGSGDPLRQDIKEAGVARDVLRRLGFDDGRVVFEDQSRNTWENAVFSKALMTPAPGETWVLITSAFHMPRAMGAFRAVDWPVLPYPVGYQTEGRMTWRIGVGKGLSSLWVAHEWIGLVAYWLMGRSPDIFPSPDSP
ncbi:MAG: YdcF family protein [Alphaproteobacteria bacterium]